MAPSIPRMHLFEIDDQTWFPPFLRRYVQAALTLAWLARPLPSRPSAADCVAQILLRELGGAANAVRYTFVDFCAGGGGPTPRIEQTINTAAEGVGGRADFVLTDLHPHVEAWGRAAARAKSGKLGFVADSVDASAATAEFVERLAEGKSGDKTRGGRGVFRLFNLAFHHFDDELARRILRNCIETQTPFGIFELQDRSIAAFLQVCILGVGVVALAPYYAFKWRSVVPFFFSWVVPILPFVLVFDGFVSSLRTRTPEEVEVLLRTCGADSTGWTVRSRRELFLPPVGYLNWVIVTKEGDVGL